MSNHKTEVDVHRKSITLKQLSRAFGSTKSQEGYVVSGIYHRIGRDDLKIVTQQAVICEEKNGTHPYRTDAYFPQIGLHIEVDEPAHTARQAEDKIRQDHIVNATRHEMCRVDTGGSLVSINSRMDEIATDIKNRISDLEASDSWEPWDPVLEYSPERYWKRGSILRVGEHEGFRKQVDAVRCLGGHHYKGLQRGGVRHPMHTQNPKHENESLWFPRLFSNRDWHNRLEEKDGKAEIFTGATQENKKYAENQWKEVDKNFKGGKAIVFAREKNSLNQVLYVFKGVFEFNSERSHQEKMEVYTRTSCETPIYPPAG